MQFIDLHRQYDVIKDKVDKRLEKVFAEKRFIGGPEIHELEEKLGDYIGVKHVIACASGTDALTIPLMAYGLNRADAVFVPSFTFFASGESVTLAGGTPIFVDSDPRTFNMDPNSLRAAIEKVKSGGALTPRGVIPVDLFGQPANHPAIRKIAEEYGLFVLEDAAQGFGGTINGKKAGSFGDVAGTSFFPAKPLGCYGDGGAIFTDDDDLASLIKSIHVHGQGADKYDNVRIGLNSRLDTIQAVFLIEKLAVFDEELEKRNKVAQYYFDELKDYVTVPVVPEGYGSSWAQFTIQLDSEKTRTELMDSLKNKGVPAMIYYPIPMHKSTAYSTQNAGVHLPVCEKLSKTVLSVPMHPYITREEQDLIIKTIIETIK